MKIILTNKQAGKILSTLSAKEISDRIGYNWALWDYEENYEGNADQIKMTLIEEEHMKELNKEKEKGDLK